MSLTNMNQQLEILYNKYRQQPEVLCKMEEYMNKQFPHALELFVERINRKQELAKQSKIYIDKFLNNPDHQYFYITQSDFFIFYNGEKYNLINEDTIWHTLLSDISTKNQLIPWKHKIKNTAIKKIKETSITSCIPESCTIQYIIQHLTPTLFRSKSEAKYLLTLLGDNILKKSTYISHFSRIESKEFLTCLQDHIQCVLGSQSLPCAKILFKYLNQPYKNCRIINFNDSVKIRTCWEGFIKSHTLDIIAVATHYSHQFKNANNYIMSHCQNTEAIRSISYLSKISADQLISRFIKEWLEPTGDSGVIKWVEMYYLWKSFIRSSCKFPIMPIFIKALKNMLSTKLNYNDHLDIYNMVTSSKLQYVKTFQNFWTDTITEGDDEFEISELWSLYINWIAAKGAKTNDINEEKMYFLIEHFSPTPIVGKIISHVKCNLWDKQEEMEDIINQLKVDYGFCQEEDIPIYKLYKDYCKKILETTSQKTVSKKYFEKYISKIIPSEYIKDNQLLKEYWTNF